MLWIVLVELGIHFRFGPAEKHAATMTTWSFKLPDNAAEFRELPVSENINAMLSYDEGQNAEWRDNTGCAWGTLLLPLVTGRQPISRCGDLWGGSRACA